MGRLRFKNEYFIGISVGVLLLFLDIYLFVDFTTGTIARWFWGVMVLAINIGGLQFFIDFMKENTRQKEIELKFLEFIRNLVENVRSGVSIPKSIIQVSNEDYGALTPYIKKLANQIQWGIPIHVAFTNFGNDTGNRVIKRSISIVIEAEESGGDIASVLESVSESVVAIKKMKEERRASAYSQIVQGYIIFFVFIVIMLILILWLFPKLMEMSGSMQSGLGGLGGGMIGKGETLTEQELGRLFLILILVQGFFAGVMIGKFSEGTLKEGLIHSLVLMTSSALIITTAGGLG